MDDSWLGKNLALKLFTHVPIRVISSGTEAAMEVNHGRKREYERENKESQRNQARKKGDL
jgi:hypothetical protein